LKDNLYDVQDILTSNHTNVDEIDLDELKSIYEVIKKFMDSSHEKMNQALDVLQSQVINVRAEGPAPDLVSLSSAAAGPIRMEPLPIPGAQNQGSPAVTDPEPMVGTLAKKPRVE
jgi:hypothetical protein